MGRIPPGIKLILRTGLILAAILLAWPYPLTASTSATSDLQRQIDSLRSGSPKEKIRAERALAHMGPRAAPAVPELIELLDSQEIYRSLWDKIFNAVTVLGSSGDSVMYEAQKTLVSIGGPAVDPLIGAIRRHSRARVRSNAALTLGDIGEYRAVEPLISSLTTDPEEEVRMWSAEALGKLGERWSRQALGRASQALARSLQDRSIHVRQKAAYALGKIRDPAAIPALIAALRDTKEDIGAGTALFMISGERFGNDVEKWQQWWDGRSGRSGDP